MERMRGTRLRVSVSQRRVATLALMTTGGFAAASTGFALATTGEAAPAASPTPTIRTAGVLPAGLDPAATEGEAATLAVAIADPSPTFTALAFASDRATIAPNGEVMFTVRATKAGGAPLIGSAVRIVAVSGPKWTTTAALRTDAAGEARISTRLLSTTTLTAVFDGSAALRPSVAGTTTVTVQAPPPAARSARTGGGQSGVMPTPTYGWVPASEIGAKAVYLASLQNGKPYVYGAEGPYAFDCSGYAQYVFKQLGRNLPRTAQEQFRATARIPPSGKQPGDLIFFGSPNNITHMGIYAGNGYMWAAPQTGRNVNLQPIYSKNYYVGRVL
ncbi:NlpC/P60 family protein [Frankia sp. Mgl5]|uniref:C40 family peptidase n=1 Tax=Frankia sp. Mgl5 TaxID=2933793 RepID=UPI00200F4B71|nr:C40 family peptidase [Frankia sp. Mgl5]MCK9929946.1 NlpC/P60 family protein [Frankia sp. Mgl5]